MTDSLISFHSSLVLCVSQSFEPTLHDASMVSFKSKMASAAASAARSAKSMAAGVSVLSGDSNYVSERIIRERKDEQTSSVGSGFASGFSELFTKPASGAQSGGAAGFFKVSLHPCCCSLSEYFNLCHDIAGSGSGHWWFDRQTHSGHVGCAIAQSSICRGLSC
jgi:hypothetical protein